jgi:hypothetical protein
MMSLITFGHGSGDRAGGVASRRTRHLPGSISISSTISLTAPR